MRPIVRSTLSLLALGNFAVAVANSQEMAAANVRDSANLDHGYILNHAHAPAPHIEAGPAGDGTWFP